jgi:hypothetical protein
MKVLFTALHLAHMRNFESVVRELAVRGHAVHLGADEAEDMGGRQLAERLAAEHPRVTWSLLPSLEAEPWFHAARKLRLGLDYARFLDARYDAFPKLRARAEERAPRLVRWAVAAAGDATRSALTHVEHLLPPGRVFDEYLAAMRPDVVVLASITYSRSQQLDLLKAARARGIPVAAAITSWDHLSSKALVHIAPDMVLVWNDTQKREAVEMHGIPEARVVVTGAQCYDQWFLREPTRDREAFCTAFGLRPDRPFVMWVHSALSPTPDPPEPHLVVTWIDALRRSADPRLRELGILIRPHPERREEWTGVDLARYDNVVVHGGNPIDTPSKADYFDALHHSSAVVGLVTSAFLEAAVVGRPVLTLTLPAYRIHQDEMLHFQYLRTVAGGVLRAAPDMETHATELASVIGTGGVRDERNRQFLGAFIRPFGLDRPATPLFVDALERLARAGPPASVPPVRAMWLEPLVRALAAGSQGTIGRYLLNDRREDAWDAHRNHDRRALDARRTAKSERQRVKAEQRDARRRLEAGQRRGKELRSALRTARFRAAMMAHRVLAFAGLARGDTSQRFRD